MKGEGILTNSVIVTIGAAIAIFIGMFVIVQVITSVSLPLSGTSVTNESKNFAVTNVFYAFTNQPSCLSAYPKPEGCGVRSGGVSRVGNVTETLNSTCYSYNATHINLTAVTSPNCNQVVGTYDVSYAYYNFANENSNTVFTNMQNTTWNAMQLLAVGLIVMAAVVILSYFAFGRKK